MRVAFCRQAPNALRSGLCTVGRNPEEVLCSAQPSGNEKSALRTDRSHSCITGKPEVKDQLPRKRSHRQNSRKGATDIPQAVSPPLKLTTRVRPPSAVCQRCASQEQDSVGNPNQRASGEERTRPGVRLYLHSGGTNLLHERAEVLKSNCDLSEVATIRTIDILGENKILTVRVLPPEHLQVGSVEVRSGPLAFDCDWLVPPRCQDKVNFVSPFVTPIGDVTVLLMSHDLI